MESIEYLAEQHECPKCGSRPGIECYEDLGELGMAPLFHPHKERIELTKKIFSKVGNF